MARPLGAGATPLRLVEPPPAPRSVAPMVGDLDAFGRELLAGLGDNPQPYRLNAARLNFADRFEQLRRVTPKRDAAKLAAVFVRHYRDLYDRKLALDRVELSRPPKSVPAPPPAEAPAPIPKTVADALVALYEAF